MRFANSDPAERPLGGDRGFVSVASKLAFVIFALVAAVSWLVAFEVTRREHEHYIEAKRRAGAMLSELFAASIAPALDFADTDAVSASLGMLAKNREVVDAVVWPVDGAAPLAQLAAKSEGALTSNRPGVGVHVAQNHIDIVLLATSPTQKKLGTVAVRVSLARENAEIAASRRRIFWLAFVLSALVATLLLAVVRRSIISPLEKLERAARRLARGELTEVLDLRKDEIGSLGRTFNHMGRAISEREKRIFAMNARLQGLLDNLRQAVVVFDADGRLGAERSKSARRVFGDSADGTNIADWLYPSESAAAVERDAFLAWLSVAAETAPADFDELGELAPREVTLRRTGEDDRLLELEFRTIPTEDGLRRFMLLATDVTSQRKLERTAETQERAHQNQLAAMRRVLAGGGQVFVRFLAATRERLAQAEAGLRSSATLDGELVEGVFRFVHTLRAEARSFSMTRVEALSLELEMELSGARHAPNDANLRVVAREKLMRGFAELTRELDRAETLFVQSSPIGRRVLEQITVSRGDVEELFRRFGNRRDELGKLAMRLAARPFGELVSTLPDNVARWAEREDKQVALAVTGREVLVPAPLCERLSGILAHLLRNAVAHGIEAPAERRAADKPESGRVDLRCLETPEGVRIEVVDDGAGFDVDALRQKANSLDANEQGIELAFLTGVSTRDTPDELAGHGVGLGAVYGELAAMGYIVNLASERGRGARVLIHPRASAVTEAAHV
jgi:two-component system chemotaxis sensor kinase CheA